MASQVSHLSSFVDILRFRAVENASSIAFTYLNYGTEVEEITEISYEQLDARARSVAARLQSWNLASKRVLLLYPHGIDFICAFFGCLYAGVLAVPVCPPGINRPLDYLESIIQNCQPTTLLTCGAIPLNLQQRLQQNPLVDSLRWIYSDADDYAHAHLWQDFQPQTDTQTHIQYTSGATGAVKGVILTHGNLIHNSEFIRQGFGNSAESTGISWLPYYHDMGLIGNILQPIFVGSKVVFMSPQHFIQKPIRWLRAISAFQGTTSGGPNFAYELCLRKISPEERQTLALQSWEVAYSGAEVVHYETIKRFQDFFAPCGFRPESFFPCYGMAEATLMITGGSRQVNPRVFSVDSAALTEGYINPATLDKEHRTLVSCGWTFPGQKVVIVDPETRTPCPANKIGEIWVSGPSVGQGYFNLPESTVNNFLARLANSDDGFFLRTGDLGFRHDGELYIVDRLKDIIVICDRNYYPQDIEWTVKNSHPLLQCSAPAATAAFSTEIEGEEKLIILQEIERSSLRSLKVYEVLNAITTAVGKHHKLVPHSVLLVNPGSLPRTSSGKIQRRLCCRYYLNGTLKNVGEARDLVEV
jgi:acyl-CoA synthetase (AMP-forming)/AMP-acid ligase II